MRPDRRAAPAGVALAYALFTWAARTFITGAVLTVVGHHLRLPWLRAVGVITTYLGGLVGPALLEAAIKQGGTAA